ncbi:I78 family peptidase inhibitor [Marimonas lutisalis]|uniref:I78 family peptidase inhibitor n=1 Tax=Marimonas lutisalis TaxID=2545756 RepID=UPI0010FA5291|nr:I78 family peptidase inhibitor [Marimonas lutisalis]
MRTPILTALAASLLLPGCMAESPPATQPDETTCGAAALQSAIGQPVNSVDLTGHDPLRILPPGSIMTMDYNPMRLNVLLDENGLITKVHCG